MGCVEGMPVIAEVDIPTGIPLGCELDDQWHAVDHVHLGDRDVMVKATASMAAQLSKNGPGSRT